MRKQSSQSVKSVKKNAFFDVFCTSLLNRPKYIELYNNSKYRVFQILEIFIAVKVRIDPKELFDVGVEI